MKTVKQGIQTFSSTDGEDPGLPRWQGTHITAVASGLKGVGKSTVAGLLAAALNRQQMTVGLLDADVTGASLSRLFGLRQTAASPDPESIAPTVTPTGIKLIELDRLLPGEKAHTDPVSTISTRDQKSWSECVWGALDHLIVNLPPGTSEATLAVCQSLPIDGVVLVTSPRDLGEMSLREAACIFKHLQIPLIGIVDNMRYITCPVSGTPICIFGTGQVDFSAQLIKTTVLGRLPLDPELACLTETGAIENYFCIELDAIAAQVSRFATGLVAESDRPRKPSTDNRSAEGLPDT